MLQWLPWLPSRLVRWVQWVPLVQCSLTIRLDPWLQWLPWILLLLSDPSTLSDLSTRRLRVPQMSPSDRCFRLDPLNPLPYVLLHP